MCDRLTGWRLAWTGSFWLELSIILGGVAAAIRMPSPRASPGALVSALWPLLLLVWIGASLGFIAGLPLSPLFVYLMMYPFWALFSLYALVTLLEIAAARRAAVIRSAAHRWIPAAICLTALVFAVLLRASPADLFKQRGPQPRIGSPLPHPLPPPILPPPA